MRRVDYFDTDKIKSWLLGTEPIYIGLHYIRQVSIGDFQAKNEFSYPGYQRIDIKSIMEYEPPNLINNKRIEFAKCGIKTGKCVWSYSLSASNFKSSIIRLVGVADVVLPLDEKITYFIEPGRFKINLGTC